MQAYEIMTRISMQNGVSGVMAAIARDTLHVEGGIIRLQRMLTSLNRTSLAIGSGLAVIGGSAVLMGMNKMVEHGEKLVHVKQQLIAAGVKEGELAQATAKSWEISRKHGLDVVQVLEDIKEARTVFGSTDMAVKLIEPLEKMRVVLNSVTEGRGDKAKAAVYEMGRAGELKGLQDPAEYISYFDSMTKAINASGGLVDPKGFAQATMYGRVATKGWDQSFYSEYLPSMMQSLGAKQSGTALMSLFGTLAQGKTSKRAFEAMADLGLIGDYSKVVYNKIGPAGFRAGAIVDTDLLIKNPAKWAQEVLVPLLKKKFGEDITPQNSQVIAALGEMFGNRMSAAAIASLALETKRIEKDVAVTRQAYGFEHAEYLLKHDPTAVMNKFKSAWTNLMTAFTEPLVQPKLDMMNKLSGAMNHFASWANANPKQVEMMGKALVALAAGVTALGAVAAGGLLLSLGGPVGLLAGLAVGIGALIALRWDGLNTKLGEFKNSSGQLETINFSGIATGFMKIKDALLDLWNFARGLVGLGPVGAGGGSYSDAADRMRAMGGGGAFSRMRQMSGPYGTGGRARGFGLGGWRSTSGAQGDATNSEVKSMVDSAAARHGVDPHVMYGIIAGESAHGNRYDIGDGGRSFSPFQMYTGGGLGNTFERQTGKSVRDPKNLPHIADYVARYIKRSGDLRPWHGYHGRAHWNPRWGSMGYSPAKKKDDATPNASPPDAQKPTTDKQSLLLGRTRVASAGRGSGGREVYGVDAVSPDVNGMGGFFDPADIGPHRRDDTLPWSKRYWHRLYRPGEHRFQRPSNPGAKDVASYMPPKRKEDDRTISVHLDGHTVGRLVERRIASSHRFTRGSADHDGRAGVPAVDYHRIA